jgi:hypothetical protein
MVFIPQDIRIDNDNDLLIQEGDFQLEYSDERHIEHILTARKGHFRFYPLCGVGIMDMFNAPVSPQNAVKFRKRIVLQLELDGYVVSSVNIQKEYSAGKQNFKFNINADRP